MASICANPDSYILRRVYACMGGVCCGKEDGVQGGEMNRAKTTATAPDNGDMRHKARVGQMFSEMKISGRVKHGRHGQ